MFNIPDFVVLLMCSYKPNQHPASVIVHQHYDSVLVTRLFFKMLALRKSVFSLWGVFHFAAAQKLYHSVICFFASLYFGLLSQNLRNLDLAITLIDTHYHAPTMGATEILPFWEARDQVGMQGVDLHLILTRHLH